MDFAEVVQDNGVPLRFWRFSNCDRSDHSMCIRENTYTSGTMIRCTCWCHMIKGIVNEIREYAGFELSTEGLPEAMPPQHRGGTQPRDRTPTGSDCYRRW